MSSPSVTRRQTTTAQWPLLSSRVTFSYLASWCSFSWIPLRVNTRYLWIACGLALLSLIVTLVMVKEIRFRGPLSHPLVYFDGAAAMTAAPPAGSLRWSDDEGNGAGNTTITSGSSHGLTNQTRKEHHHVFFLKVHKAASTTVMNLLYRFALKRHLAVMLPRYTNILSERNRYWKPKVAAELPPGLRRFDMLCNHVVFNEVVIRDSLYKDTKFIGIVRNPLSQFESSFRYYHRISKWLTYLQKIPGPDPIGKYLESPGKWENSDFSGSFTHNRMSFDFGMDDEGLRAGQAKEGGAIDAYLRYLDRTFNLVMICERFDESMVLMKRLLGWRLRDVIYLKSNVYEAEGGGSGGSGGGGGDVAGSHSTANGSAIHIYTAQERQTHRSFNAADYALYEHFVRVFEDKVNVEGESFAGEVEAFRSLLQQVAAFCRGTPGVHADSLTLAATPWNDSFQVRRWECEFMKTRENDVVDIVRKEQHKRYSMVHV